MKNHIYSYIKFKKILGGVGENIYDYLGVVQNIGNYYNDATGYVFCNKLVEENKILKKNTNLIIQQKNYIVFFLNFLINFFNKIYESQKKNYNISDLNKNLNDILKILNNLNNDNLNNDKLNYIIYYNLKKLELLIFFYLDILFYDLNFNIDNINNIIINEKNYQEIIEKLNIDDNINQNIKKINVIISNLKNYS